MWSQSEPNHPKSRVRLVFDRPFRRDWIFWLFVVTVVAYAATRLNGMSSGETIEPVSGLIDAVFAIAINYVIWAVIPAVIRSRLRSRRGQLEASQSSPSQGRSVLNDPRVTDAKKAASGDLGHRVRAAVTENPWLVVALVVALFFVHGNWEYRKLVSDIENGEEVLIDFNEDMNRVTNSLRALGSYPNPAAVQSLLQKIEVIAGSHNDRHRVWRDRVRGSLQAPWNEQTRISRDLILAHWNAWDTSFRNKSIDANYKGYSADSSAISNSWDEFCDHFKIRRSILTWPSSSTSAMKSRISKVCSD